MQTVKKCSAKTRGPLRTSGHVADDENVIRESQWKLGGENCPTVGAEEQGRPLEPEPVLENPPQGRNHRCGGHWC